MRGFAGLAGMIAIAATVAGVEPAGAVCSVFSRLTDGMAGAIAGKPIAIRFVDNRDLP